MEAARKAGELKRPEKSSTTRSTEAVARMLTMEKDTFDVGAEIRDAENQTDLNRAQKKVVRMQAAENRKEAGLSKKTLVGAPKYVLEAAREEQERFAAKKAEKAKLAQGGKDVAATERTDAGCSHEAASSSSSVMRPSSDAPDVLSGAASGVFDPTATASESVCDVTALADAQREQSEETVAALGGRVDAEDSGMSTSRRKGRWAGGGARASSSSDGVGTAAASASSTKTDAGAASATGYAVTATNSEHEPSLPSNAFEAADGSAALAGTRGHGKRWGARTT
eukprot:gnl/TRDRNA2_/TRDRNA2_159866_c0_seq1.p1 gnl/TRDRNA2_/TRDRNA2_159866_c0~~gnl/TRDRNA2_/TRDRNA2_159866_c0_seq1.p1  ORF type:complete len:282 (+),score=68.48 gnl/TRDRNA2_/TRDRNA2_159866_c0_seq1:105-950(+)